MQGFAEKKRETEELHQKKKQKSSSPLSGSLSEGPMLLSETKSLEAQARAAYERSVKIELAAIKRLAILKKKLEAKKKRLRNKKGRKKGKKE